MPIVSKKQQGFMFSEHPRIAKKMAEKMKRKSGKKHPLKGLPEKSRKSKDECETIEGMESIR
jgi:hypothetical protein